MTILKWNLGFKNPSWNFVLCLVLKWSVSKNCFILEHGYIGQKDVCNSALMDFLRKKRFVMWLRDEVSMAAAREQSDITVALDRGRRSVSMWNWINTSFILHPMDFLTCRPARYSHVTYAATVSPCAFDLRTHSSSFRILASAWLRFAVEHLLDLHSWCKCLEKKDFMKVRKSCSGKQWRHRCHREIIRRACGIERN